MNFIKHPEGKRHKQTIRCATEYKTINGIKVKVESEEHRKALEVLEKTTSGMTKVGPCTWKQK